MLKDSLEVLVIDEADQVLLHGYGDDIKEIVVALPPICQVSSCTVVVIISAGSALLVFICTTSSWGSASFVFICLYPYAQLACRFSQS